MAAALLAPLAAAQAPAPIQAQVEPPPVAKPLGEHVEAPFTLDVSCLLASADAQPLPVRAWVAQAPAWATAVASPSTFQLDPKSCTGPRMLFHGVVAATVGQNAPAWTPASLVLGASVESVQGNASTTAATNLSAGFYSILDATVADAVATVGPGGTHAFPVALSNHGNDRTRVSFRVLNASDWLEVGPLPDVVFDSKQQGGARTTQDVPVNVKAHGGSALTNRVGTLTVEVSGTDEHEPHAPGDSVRVSFVLTERGAAAPGPSPGWIVAAVALLALARRLR